MKIRLATLNDLEQYTNLLQTTYEAAYTDNSIGLTADCFSKEIFASKDTQQYLKSHLKNDKKQKTWLTEKNKYLVGSITVILKNEKEAELTGYYVHPNYQGRGIGKKLYEKALQFAGNRDLVLDIYAHNTSTIKMYKKWGWKLDTTRGGNGYFYRHWPEWPDGVQAKCIYMRKIYQSD